MKVKNPPPPSHKLGIFLVIIKKIKTYTTGVFGRYGFVHHKSFCLKFLLQAHGFKTMLTLLFPS